MLGEIVNELNFRNIEYAVISSSLVETNIKSEFEEKGFNILSFLDSRSAGYAATGICAEQKKPVVFITENNNDSRNGYSALTEAYYKKLPIIFISISTDYVLNYVNELKDTVIMTSFVNQYSRFDPSIIDLCIEKSMPVHIVIEDRIELAKDIKDVSEDIRIINKSENYIYMSNLFIATPNTNASANIVGGYDGIVSNILGASLSKKFKKYIGICTDVEILHDLNALGNRFMNDSVSFIVYFYNNKKVIENYAKDLEFEILEGRDKISEIRVKKKSIVFIKGD